MLYLDYSRPAYGGWIPNAFGGKENLEAIEFLKHTNSILHARFPGILMIAEESTSWPNVSRPTDHGGLGFGFKWNMGWMHDTLSYFSVPPADRKWHHGRLTFSIVYAFNENFVLSLSHDEVVHLKRSLLGKMPGEEWETLCQPAAAVHPDVRPSRARSCCSWAASWARRASGATRPAWSGGRWRESQTARSAGACRI